MVWQGFHGDNSDIFLRHYDGNAWSEEIRVTDSPANDWKPQIAVDAEDQAHIVWDSYRNGNYDVFLRRYANGRLGPEVTVADTARFEAHASVAVDPAGRVWVAWGGGRKQLGKGQRPHHRSPMAGAQPGDLWRVDNAALVTGDPPLRIS